MTDLELERLCAEAMGYRYKTHEDNDDVNFNYPGVYLYDSGSNMWNKGYYPLHDDAQAMALVKKMRLYIAPEYPQGWDVGPENTLGKSVINADLNRAICECVAQIQQEQKTA